MAGKIEYEEPEPGMMDTSLVVMFELRRSVSLICLVDMCEDY